MDQLLLEELQVKSGCAVMKTSDKTISITEGVQISRLIPEQTTSYRLTSRHPARLPAVSSFKPSAPISPLRESGLRR
ncbi:hypothetical protein CRENBAI_009441 [Crenichthys baileyi]|uniref:Uncharacterized protein n=1 Tax=Crenichthys baileyi TaxID=28760 RepID=A0AAV9SLY8_9TELE